MDTLTERERLDDIVLAEPDNYLGRTAGGIAPGAAPGAGTVMGRVTIDTSNIVATRDAGNTGDGVLTLADPAFGTGVEPGTYVLSCIGEAPNGGVFSVETPSGVTLATANVGVAYDGVLRFTIANGATDFAVGDQITVTVGAGSGRFKACTIGATDGSADPVGVLLQDVDAETAEVADALILTGGPAQVNRAALVFDASFATEAQESAAIAALGKLGIRAL